MAKLFNKRGSGDDAAALEDEVAAIRSIWARSPGSLIVFGAPSRCPECGDIGIVESVDTQTGRCDNYCVRCRRSWVITQRALRAAGPPPAATAADPEPAPAMAPPAVEEEPPPVQVREFKLLLVEDDPADAELIRTLLEPFAPEGVKVLHTQSQKNAKLANEQRGPFDVVLLDLGLPDSVGLSTVSQWRATGDLSPVVVLSGNDHPGLEGEARRAGASAFMHKRRLVEMAATPRGAERWLEELRSLAAPRTASH